MDTEEQTGTVDPEALVARRREAFVPVGDFADFLGIDRGTLWKREKWPGKAPDGWWDAYDAALRTYITQQASRALTLIAE